MSWRLDGRLYHSYNEYVQALAEREQVLAARQVEHLARRGAELEQRIARSEQAVERFGRDSEQLARATAAVSADVAELRGVMQHMEDAQRAAERRLDQDFEQLRGEQTCFRVGLDQLKDAHDQHVQRVREQFRQHQQELQTGLQEAERRRQKMEIRLDQSIRQVDAKVEAERHARLARETTALGRAAAQVEITEATLQDLQGKVASLGLDEELASIRNHLEQARALHLEQRPEASLAASSNALADMRTLQYSISKRQAELEAGRNAAVSAITYAESLLSDPAVAACFAPEKKRLEKHLKYLGERTAMSYRDYNNFRFEAERDRTDCRRVETTALQMLAAAPVVQSSLRDRQEKLKALLRDLVKAYGPATSVKPRLGDPEDCKSALIAECQFGAARVNVHLACNGTYAIDGFGHADNASCHRAAARLTSALSTNSMVTGQHLDAVNRAAPATELQRATGADDAIAQITGSLTAMESSR